MLPLRGVNVPAAQARHVDEPLDEAKRPAVHSTHEREPFDAIEVRPGGHNVHAVSAVALEKRPAEQLEQLDLAMNALAEPVSQALHSALPLEGCALPSGHGVQDKEPLDAATKPAPQRSHSIDAGEEEKRPSSHWMQAVAPT